jgi:hypothetical protein
MMVGVVMLMKYASFPEQVDHVSDRVHLDLPVEVYGSKSIKGQGGSDPNGAFPMTLQLKLGDLGLSSAIGRGRGAGSGGANGGIDEQDDDDDDDDHLCRDAMDHGRRDSVLESACHGGTAPYQPPECFGDSERCGTGVRAL